MRWDLETILKAIKYRLDKPESIPGKSHYAAYREDISTLLQIIEELQNERREQERRS